MSKQKITAEELNKVLLYTASALPDNPSERGMKPREIKAFFYKYISILVDILNEKFNGAENSRTQGLSEHDADELSHNDIRNVLSTLIEKDTELGNLISSSLAEHNDSDSAHEKITLWLKQLQERIENVNNLASGKSKIIPVKDIYELKSKLSSELNIGDKFVLAQENVPDFTLFEKNSTSTDAIELSDISLMLGLELEPGKSYLCNGFLLVATESGIDTSLFAKQAELDNVKTELATKETKKALKSESAETVMLASDTEYNLGLRTSVVLALPEEIPNEFEVIVNFRSGAVATAFDAPNSIVFTQDDCYLGRLTPITNRIYEINIKNVGGVLIGKVGCCDYEVIE